MSNEVAVQQNFSVRDLQFFASTITKSNLFGIKDESQALALMMIAQAEGRHPATIAQEYDIIQGRPALKSMAALARFQRAGGKIKWLKRSEEECAAKFVHPLGGELEISWTFARAQAAGLTTKDNWKKFLIQMLSARVVAEGVRACFPACLNGFYLSEEVADFEQKPRAVDFADVTQKHAATQTLPPPSNNKPAVSNEERTAMVDNLINTARAEGMSDDAISNAIRTTEWKSMNGDQYKALSIEVAKIVKLRNAAQQS